MTGRLLARRFAEGVMRRGLRHAFRRVVWLGPLPVLPEAPVVLYANHHYFHDGYLLWLLTAARLGRHPLLWMEQWDRVPIFSAVGAFPFPADDPKARVATVRETARRMKRDPKALLFLYPEAVLGPPDAGLAPFRADLPRIARLLPPETQWWPVGLRATWWGESRPTALLTGGPLHQALDGDERTRLEALLDRLHAARPDDLAAGRAHVLLDGGRAEERWDLSPLAPLFRRWT